MNLTYSTLAAPAWPLDQIIQAAADKGIAGIDFRGVESELDITNLPAFTTDLPQTLEKLKRHNLQMPCVNTSITLVTPPGSKWDGMLGEAVRYAQLAGRTNTRYLRLFGGSIPAGMTRDDARELAQQHLRAIVNICQPHNCKPLLETHDAWVLSGNILQLLEGFAPGEAGVLWDLEHPWRGGEFPADTAARLNRRIEHIHIKDTIRIDGKSIPKLLGEGELPLMECKAALASINYTGWICLETEKRWHADGPEPEISVPQFAKYIREVWG